MIPLLLFVSVGATYGIPSLPLWGVAPFLKRGRDTYTLAYLAGFLVSILPYPFVFIVRLVGITLLGLILRNYRNSVFVQLMLVLYMVSVLWGQEFSSVFFYALLLTLNYPLITFAILLPLFSQFMPTLLSYQSPAWFQSLMFTGIAVYFMVCEHIFGLTQREEEENGPITRVY